MLIQENRMPVSWIQRKARFVRRISWTAKASLLSVLLMFTPCDGHSQRRAAIPPLSESERNSVELFKKLAGQDRMESWKILQPLLTNRLASISKSKQDLATFFEMWLGPPETNALKAVETTVVWQLAPQRISGDVFAYSLKSTNDLNYFLVIDFRVPEKTAIGVLSEYNPVTKRGKHDEISQAEKLLAKELGAVDINLGAGSEDGSAKPGFNLSLNSSQSPETKVQQARKLSTLVSLRLTGRRVTDSWLSHLEGHDYLASLDLVSTSVTDQGLKYLFSVKALKWLTITDTTAVTENGVRSLKAALPKCEVELTKRPDQ
jgi:hypothetical protein